ncbi:MAG: DUF5995 family protein [Nannocystales bacterium]
MTFSLGSIDDVDDVIEALDTVLALGVRGRHRWAIFAAMYRRVTIAVKHAIERGEFDDGPRMSRFDAVFALRYLRPLQAYLRGASVPRAWSVAFRATEDPSLTAMQLLLLGVNAHINLDLGFSVVEAGLEPEPFRTDFDRINAILAGELDGVQEALDAVSPWLSGVDRIAGRADERLGVFVVVRARDQAWRSARAADSRSSQERAVYEATVDRNTAALAERIAYPRFPLSLLVRLIGWRESWTVPRMVELLGRPL